MTSYVVFDAGFVFKLLVPNAQRAQLRHLVEAWVGQQTTLCAPYLWLYELTSLFSNSCTR